MRLTLELPAKPVDRDYKTVGLPRKANQAFWLDEDQFNYNWNSAINGLLFFFSLVVSVLLFIGPYDGPIDAGYLLLQTVHSAHVHLVFFSFLNSVYSLNLFFNQLLNFFAKKFRHLLKRVQRLNAAGRVDQRKLAKLIYQFQVVNFELMEMNAFFSSFVGVSLIHSSGFIVFVSKSSDSTSSNEQYA